MQLYVGFFPRSFVRSICSGRCEVHGLARVQDLHPPHGVILVSNHRSFFDMFAGSCLLYNRASFMNCLYFPVRSGFFFTSPLGLVVSFLMSGCAMWPPIFRDDRREPMNPISFRQMLFALSQEGAILGIHPEGTRGQGDDPHTLLPGKPGLGRLVRACHPNTLVLPFFIGGISNRVGTEVKRRLWPRTREGNIRVRFGTPIPCGDLQRQSDYPGVTGQVMDILTELADQDRRHLQSDKDGVEADPAAPASNGTLG